MFDLHFHSDASDGAATLATVTNAVAAHGELARVALTDHDTIASSSRLAEIDARAWVGAEITSFTGKRRIDLLALGIRPDDLILGGYFTARAEERRSRFLLFGELLRAQGWVFEPPADVLYRPLLAQPHVVGELRRHAVNQSRLLDMGLEVAADGKDPIYGAVLDSFGPTIRSQTESAVIDGPGMVAMIHAAGGLAVIAHPWISPYDKGHQTRAKARRLLGPLVAAGVDGVELWHHDQTEPSVLAEIQGFAVDHGLLVTAGSDDHSADLAHLGTGLPAAAADVAAITLAALEAAWRKRQARPS